MPRPLVPQRRRRILDAASRLALETGWEQTTVAAIAAAAGIGKGAVYREFADKAAILDAALRRATGEVTARVRGRVEATAEEIDLPTAYRWGVEALLGEPLLRALFLADDRVLGEHVGSVRDGRYAARADWVVDYLTALQAGGVVDDDVDARTAGRMLSVFTLGLVHAPGTLGPLTDDELLETVTLFAQLIGAGLRPAIEVAPDRRRAASRAAELVLLDRLTRQKHPTTPEDDDAPTA